MRKVCVAIAAIVAVASLASPAMAADPIKTLNRKVAALQQQVKTLRADLSEAQETLDCLGPVAPMAPFGGVFDGVPEGYLYGVGQNAETVFMTTSLDLLDNTTGLTPGVDYGLLMTWAGSCASEPPTALRVQLRPLSGPAVGRALARLAW